MRSLKAIICRFCQNIVSLHRHGKTVRRYALSRHQELVRQYLDENERFFRPPSQRKLRSPESLYLFPEAQLIAEQARYSIEIEDFDLAHTQLDQAFEVLREAGHQRFLEEMRHYPQKTRPR
jgi:hypothetical protein